MKPGQRQWTRDELLLAVNLYCKLPFGRMNSRNPDIIALAALIQRTSGSVALKLCNFASLDASLPRTGMTNVSQLDRQVWGEFCADWNEMAFESERLLANTRHITLEEAFNVPEIDEELPLPSGRVKEQLIKTRVNQQFFRQAVLAAYDNTCCITGFVFFDLVLRIDSVARSAIVGTGLFASVADFFTYIKGEALQASSTSKATVFMLCAVRKPYTYLPKTRQPPPSSERLKY
jgi:hypothetical protein